MCQMLPQALKILPSFCLVTSLPGPLGSVETWDLAEVKGRCEGRRKPHPIGLLKTLLTRL